MKQEYRVQWMNYEQYMNYMSGAIFYNFETTYVEAEDEEEAKAIVLFTNKDCYHINSRVITRAQEEAEEAEQKAKQEEEEAKKAAAKARKVARDLANGITPEKRKAITNLRRHEGNATRLEREIERLKEELETERKIIKKKKAAIEKM